MVEVSIGGGDDETCRSLVAPPLEHPANRNWPVKSVMASTRDRVDLVTAIVLLPKDSVGDKAIRVTIATTVVNCLAKRRICEIDSVSRIPQLSGLARV